MILVGGGTISLLICLCYNVEYHYSAINNISLSTNESKESQWSNDAKQWYIFQMNINNSCVRISNVGGACIKDQLHRIFRFSKSFRLNWCFYCEFHHPASDFRFVFAGETLKPQENENITFRMKGGMTMVLTKGIRKKTNEKGSFRTIYSDSLSQNRWSHNYLL